MLKSDRKLRDYARHLVTVSLDETGRVSSERVEAILQTLASKPPRHLKSILKLFLYYIRHELRKSEAVVEHAGAISPETMARLEDFLSERYQRRITASSRANRDLIAGLRVSIADDVFDTSIAGQLATLAQSVS